MEPFFIEDVNGYRFVIYLHQDSKIREMIEKAESHLKIDSRDLLFCNYNIYRVSDILNKTLRELGIQRNSHIYFSEDFSGGGYIGFNSLRDENLESHNFAPNDPNNLRIVDSGLNAEGICKTQTCKAYNQKVFAALGYGEKITLYNITMFLSKCRYCGNLLEDVLNFYFVRSTWFFKGRLFDGEKISTVGSPLYTENGKYTTYKPDKKVDWAYLEITVRPHGS